MWHFYVTKRTGHAMYHTPLARWLGCATWTPYGMSLVVYDPRQRSMGVQSDHLVSQWGCNPTLPGIGGCVCGTRVIQVQCTCREDSDGLARPLLLCSFSLYSVLVLKQASHERIRLCTSYSYRLPRWSELRVHVWIFLRLSWPKCKLSSYFYIRNRVLKQSIHYYFFWMSFWVSTR